MESESIIKRILRRHNASHTTWYYYPDDHTIRTDSKILYLSVDNPYLSAAVELHNMHLLMGIDEIEFYNILFRWV